jgi:hypothetical protein
MEEIRRLIEVMEQRIVEEPAGKIAPVLHRDKASRRRVCRSGSPAFRAATGALPFLARTPVSSDDRLWGRSETYPRNDAEVFRGARTSRT